MRARQGFDRKQQAKMLLSAPTRLGLRLRGIVILLGYLLLCNGYLLIALAFIELVQQIFQNERVTAFLSNRICQDPLENYFGRQRRRDRVNENPSAAEFIKNTQAL